ncbi:helix-hairpin-helix domain-containing protein [Natrinema salsiterrestre]|uniref:Helix-hairpin-helix domain-containing protein n=1 Tax=Natrinema salsiterrestre TaxID=2950540 RepID=A0A9Q4L1K5_9EURY|nr:helix-hairpin-helix domain-containing protein [Natrinema salsiterrestre]MDF9744822.1 helix-hairpin-helix domain-containing protein [Natrinema salsiterrestre]
MSQSESPIRAMFDAQRTAVKQSQQLFKHGMATQRNVDTMALTGLKGQASLQRQQLALAQAATHGYVSATAAMLPSDDAPEAHRTIDETFDQLQSTHTEFYDALEREVERDVESANELSEEFVDALDEQTDQLLEMTRSVEDQAVQNVDEFSGQLREQLERTQELQDQLEDRLEDQTGDVETLLERQAEQIEQFQQQLEEQAEAVTREIPVQGTDEPHTKIETDAEHTLEAVEGIDADVREQLSEAGITTIQDLTRAGAENVAEAADISESQAEEWIEQAEA